MRANRELNSEGTDSKGPGRIRKGDVLTVDIERFADRGKSIAKVDGLVVFVRGGVPGDRARVGITNRRKRFVEGRIEELVKASDMRVEAPCQYFGACGGCTWQHVDYTSQLNAKRESVHDALVRLGGFENIEVEPVIGADPVYRYRNKMEFSCSARRWLTDWEIASGEQFDKTLAIGMHAAGRFDRVIDLQECHLVSETGVEILNGLRQLAQREGWPAWNVRKQEGFLRNVVLRLPEHGSDVMVNVVTGFVDEQRMKSLSEFLQHGYPGVTTLVNTINDTPAQTAFGDRVDVVFGPGVVHERLAGFEFEIGPSTFFQTNTRQTEELYKVAVECARLSGGEVVYDLYCGCGTISLCVSQSADRVVGVELVEEAVESARRNAERNGVTNCTFVSGDMRRVFSPSFVHEHGRPDVLIVDPPRAGMHPKVVARIAELRPLRIVYVSCNPQTQARDLAALKDHYVVERAQPVDLFPHTFHIESVVGLRATHVPDEG
jgi:23S rRNA (uracil1939-C5)-methyltransferase